MLKQFDVVCQTEACEHYGIMYYVSAPRHQNYACSKCEELMEVTDRDGG